MSRTLPERTRARLERGRWVALSAYVSARLLANGDLRVSVLDFDAADAQPGGSSNMVVESILWRHGLWIPGISGNGDVGESGEYLETYAAGSWRWEATP